MSFSNIPSTLPINWIIHIDMDAFYASIEQMDNPDLQGKPVVVGGGDRGVAAAASYEARKYGIRSAMPTGMIKKLCPHVIFVPGRRTRYVELSQKVMHALSNFSPLIEQASIDEAYVDATGLENLFGPIERIIPQMQQAVHTATGGLTCSVGAAPVKFLAKIASDIHKPHGSYILYPHAIPTFLQSLPVEKIPGVGKKFHEALQSFGIRFASDVTRFSVDFWEGRFGKAGVQLYDRALGKDVRKIEPFTAPKSESSENTFATDTFDKNFLQQQLMAQAERVGTNLRKHNYKGRTITLKVKYADFTQLTRSRTLTRRTNSTQTIFETACELLHALRLTQKVRLIGLAVSGFDIRQEQNLLPITNTPCFQEQEEHKRMQLDTVLDNVRARFGKNAIIRGRLFDAPKN